MLASLLSFILVTASLSGRVVAQINLNSFPDTVNVEKSYTLSWTATANYSYTIWLVRANDYQAGEYDWTKVAGLAPGLEFDTLSPSYRWTVPSNSSTSGFYALWIDAFPIPFDGASLFNITDWFAISASVSSSTSATSSATPSATHTNSPSTHTPSSEHHGSSISGGAIAGIVIGLLVALALIVGALLLVRRRKKQAGIKDREAQARANRLAPVMQSPAAIEMHGRQGELAKETNV